MAVVLWRNNIIIWYVARLTRQWDGTNNNKMGVVIN